MIWGAFPCITRVIVRSQEVSNDLCLKLFDSYAIWQASWHSNGQISKANGLLQRLELGQHGGYSNSSSSNGRQHIEAETKRRHFADDIFKCIFLNENGWIPIKISLKFVPKGPINNIPALVQIMAWRRPGDKPLSEPMMVRSLTHICVTRPQWVKTT